MRYITIHQSASNNPNHDDIRIIHQWHTEPPRNWRKCGYHYFIKSNGDIQDNDTNPDEARRMNPFEQGAHVGGHNKENIGICLHGRTGTFTEAQFRSLRRLVNTLMVEYNIQPDHIRGHNEFSGHESRECPGFDYRSVIWNRDNTAN